MPSPADCQPDHPFLHYLVTVLQVAVYEQQPKTAPIPRYDGPTDGYTADITRLLEGLVQRMYTAEDALRNLQASQTETRETHSATSADTLPSRPSSASLTTSGSDSITDNNIPQAPSHQAALSSSLSIDPNLITPTTSDPDTSATDELSNLKAQVQGISNVCDALARGDLSQKITVTVQDAALVQVKDAINSTIDKLSRYSQELARVSWDVGVKGLFGGQVDVTNNMEGVWLEMARNVNRMFAHVTNQVRSIGKVTTGIARGNFEYNLLDMEVEGEMLWIKGNLDKTMGLLNGFATEVTRVTQDIGTHGKLGYQARIADTSGTWENLKNDINVMAANLTVQIRTIALAISAVTRGDFTQSIVGLSVSGEMLELVNNINRLVDQLRTNNIHT